MESYIAHKQDLILDVLKGVNKKLDRLLAGQFREFQQEQIMSAELDALSDKVAANTTVTQSAVTLLNGLGAQIASLKNDPVKLQALADQLTSDDAGLAAAVTANTPASGPGPGPGTGPAP